MVGLELLHLHAADIGDNQVLDGGKVGFVGFGCPLVFAALFGQPIHQELCHRHRGRDQKSASRQLVFDLLLSVRCLLFGGKTFPFVAALAVLIFVPPSLKNCYTPLIPDHPYREMRWSDERKDKRCVHKKEDFPLSQNGSVCRL